MLHLRTSLPVKEAGDRIEESVLNGSFSGECIDSFYRLSPGGAGVLTLVFEKYFMRNSSRASLTVTVTDIAGVTEVHAVGSGGGQGGILSFDWGASDDFEIDVQDALEDYLL